MLKLFTSVPENLMLLALNNCRKSDGDVRVRKTWYENHCESNPGFQQDEKPFSQDMTALY